jgi:hypothetical protein
VLVIPFSGRGLVSALEHDEQTAGKDLMKLRILGLVALIALANQALAQRGRDVSAIEVYSNNDKVPMFDDQKDLTLMFWVQQLILSALYRNVIQDSSPDEWQRQLAASTRIHCRYSSVVALAIPERPTLSFDEALLPLQSDSYPSYIFIKEGQRVQRLAKYDPWVLHKLVVEANLPLYKSLSRVERGLF